MAQAGAEDHAPPDPGTGLLGLALPGLRAACLAARVLVATHPSAHLLVVVPMTAQPKPTAAEVRAAYIDRKDFEDQIGHVERRGDEAAGAEFDRWLAEHDAQVLRDAADAYRSGDLTGMFLGRDDYPRAWLRARAARVEAGDPT